MSRGDFTVYCNHDSCMIRVMDSIPTNWAIAEATHVGDGLWFVNRVLVRDPERRGNGLGGQTLDMMLTKLRTEGARFVIVTPGGYDGDQERQTRFYVKHGFVELQEGEYKGAYCRELVADVGDEDVS